MFFFKGKEINFLIKIFFFLTKKKKKNYFLYNKINQKININVKL
jgi:hypothetical protein